MFMANTKRIKAIAYSENSDRAMYLVMTAHAGRNDRTGTKVHLATLTHWKESGRWILGACTCSGNGQLRGSNVIPADFGGFERVTCKKCGASPEAAAHRNAKAIDLEVTL